jgi:hypothetical protein
MNRTTDRWINIACLLLWVALAGCSSVGKFDNVIVMSLSGDRAFVSSLYGPIGITAELRADDARELRAVREKVAAAERILSAGAQRPVTLQVGP